MASSREEKELAAVVFGARKSPMGKALLVLLAALVVLCALVLPPDDSTYRGTADTTVPHPLPVIRMEATPPPPSP